jgi:competence protein ComEC
MSRRITARAGRPRASARLPANLDNVLSELRARPLHLAVGGLVVGLVAGPRAPALVLVALALCPLVAGRAMPALAVAAAVLGGALIADARLAALDHSTLGPRLGHATSVDVVLTEAPRPRQFGGRSAVVRLGSERVLVRTPARVAWPGVAVGQELRVDGVLRSLRPGDAWLRPRNVHAVLAAERVRATGRARGGVAGVLDGARERAQRALQGGVPAPQAALLRGMVLGQDEALPAQTREDFQVSGLAHLVAASGQNVLLLCALVFGLSAVAGVGLRMRLLAALALIALYVPLAGGGPSIQRAGVMGAAGVTATLAGRPATRWYALLLAAAATLGVNPRAVEEPGWQMSFAAVAAIMALARRTAEPLRRRGVPAGLAEAIALTMAATIGTAPLIAVHFDRTSVVSLGANLVAAPAVAPVMWLGMAAAAVGQVSAAAAMPFSALAGYPLAFVAWVGHAAAGLPAADVAAPAAVVTVVCATAVAVTVSRTARRPAVLAIAVVVVGAVVALSAPPAAPGPPPGLRVTFLDVGQGDATLIQHRRTSVLVDSGPPDGEIVGRLRRAGVRRLDLLVVTHAQADHEGGAAAVLRAMPVSLVLDGRDGVRDVLGARMAAEARRLAVPRALPQAGQTLRAGAIALRVLWPSRDGPVEAGADPNDRAIVAEARIGRVRILLTSDAESAVLSALDLAPVDVLKVSHHGSADPGLARLLERLRPRVAAIEVGAGNTYGHPVPATIRTLRASGAVVYRTDRDGSVRLEERGGALTVTRHA